MVRPRIALGALALVVVAVPAAAVAASGDTEPDDSAPAEQSGPPSASLPNATDAEAEGAAEDEQPPIDVEFQVDMMLGLVPEAEMNEYWAQQGEEQQLQIQACMNESGFEYNLEDQGQMVFTDPLGDMPRLEYAEQYGFGLWTTMDPESDPYADINADYEWPNQEIVDGLSESEQNAWFEVNMRCSNDAYTTMDDDPFRNPEVQQAMEDFYTDIDNDPRLRDAQAAWVACMEEAGHPYPSEQEMWDDVNAGDDDYSLHQQFYDSEAWESSSEDHERWQQLVDREIEVAVANAGCVPALEEAREQVTADLRDDLIAVWQTIDWSLPPVTYEGEGDIFMMPGDSMSMGSEVDGTVVEGAETTEAEPETDDAGATTEPPVGLDLGDPAATTEP